MGNVESIKKIEIGFTNEVYLVDNKYILKVCKDPGNEERFEKEVFCYDYFKSKISVPEVVVYDNSLEIYPRFFMIYPKMKGLIFTQNGI